MFVLPGPGRAQFIFTTNANDSLTITGYTGPGGSVAIPDTIGGQPVAAIGDNAFSRHLELTDVSMPDSITSIGAGAFNSCSNLTAATIGTATTNIGSQAFTYCTALTNINVNPSNGVYASVNGVLFDKLITTLITYPGGLIGGYVVPDSVACITSVAFASCSGLTTVTIGDNVTNINDHAFIFCSNLTNATIGSAVTSIGVGAFDNCLNLKTVTIPNSVVTIGDSAFFHCGLTSVAIPNSVITIGNSAFWNCPLINVTFGSSVLSIGVGAFQGCPLTSVMIPNSVTSIGRWAFGFCSKLTTVTIGNSLTNLGQWAFAGCPTLLQIHFQGNAPSVNGVDGGTDTSVFQNDGAGNVYYLAGATGWGASFGGWPASALATPASDFTYITNYDNTITITGYLGSGGNVTIPATINGCWVTTIGASAFSNQTAITSLTIPYSVSSVGNWAFASCSGLTNVLLDGSVSRLGQWVFANCANLHQVLFQGDAPTVNGEPGGVDTTTFLNDSGTALYYSVNTGWTATFGGWPTAGLLADPLLFSYTAAPGGIIITGFLGLGGNITIPDAINGSPVVGIAAFAFWNQAITSVTIPASITSIGGFALANCYDLTNITVDPANPNFASLAGVLCDKSGSTLLQFPRGRVGSYTIPNGVTTIGTESFFDCSNLTNVIIANSVTFIEDQAFVGCSGLTSLLLGSGVTNMGNLAFDGCTSLMSISVDPANLIFASAGGVLFNKTMTTLIQCPQAKAGSYAIPDGVTSISQDAFSQCSALTALTMPDSLTSIGDWGVQYCSSLKSLTFGNAVSDIGYGACWYCSSLTNVTIDACVTNIGEYAFSFNPNLLQAHFLGNAPMVSGSAGSSDSTVFYGDTGTVYYLPGTTGWTATFGGWPTTPWCQPQPQIFHSGADVGVQHNGFEFTISWATNTAVVIEASTNLQTWTPVATNALENGTNSFSDSAWMKYPQRFYRVHSQ